ncbi:MAG: PDZ domain-containing protein [Sphingomonadaceae bacterium]|nr:PDZ domain-containing protein [Sphingomonadaceae bacterium]
MGLDGDRRAARLRARLPRLTAYSWAELILLVLIAMQCARLVWLLAAPVGPVGDWKATSSAVTPQDPALLARFDPFFRLDGAPGPTVVTSLNLKLYGVREDRASGRGSAIIALPDGRQMSFAVGEEVMPGVILTAVGFDNVTISRGGATEQIFLDQSGPAEAVGAPQTVVVPQGAVPQQAGPAAPMQVVTVPTAPPPPPPIAAAPGRPINFTPRTSNGRVTGLVVTPGSDGGRAFAAAGFAPGDVIVAINGQRISSLEQARAAIQNGEVNVTVDRGGMAVPLHVRMSR